MGLGYSLKKPPKIDLNSHAAKVASKGSHLHQLKDFADPNGNRAARRAAKKLKRKK